MKKKICVITGTRAEYGLFYPLLKLFRNDSDVELQLLVTGMHLSPEFGSTYLEIEKDGFVISEKIEMLLSGDTETAVAKSMGLGVISFADALERLSPDLIVVLGDRFETFSAVLAAFIKRIPVAHLYGGELTEGLIDEGIRHSITKMSQLHFVSTEIYRKRVIQLGENPDSVFNVGAIGLDNIMEIKLLPKRELERELNFKFGKKNAVVTFHPVTLEEDTAKEQFTELLGALNSFEDVKIIFTKPNADANGRAIIKLIDEYVSKFPQKSIAFTSLGQLKYLSCLSIADLVIGNSSSGIIEVPSFGIPTVNIGDRQNGRLKARSVIDSNPDKKSITNSISKALYGEFAEKCKNISNPYGDGRSSKKIWRTIKSKLSKKIDIKKKFHDLEFEI